MAITHPSYLFLNFSHQIVLYIRPGLSLDLSIFNPDRAVLKTSSLLVVNLATLSTTSVAVFDLGLPCWDTSHEHLLNILECLSSCLREKEESVDSHGEAEDTEDEVDAPLDVNEGGWDEIRESKVEDPELRLALRPVHTQ